MAFLFVANLLRNKNKRLLIKILMKMLQILLLSAGLIHTFSMLKEVKMIPSFSYEMVSSGVVGISNSIRSISMSSSNLCKTIFLSTVLLLIAVLFLRREAEMEHGDGFFEFHNQENDVQIVHQTPRRSPPPSPPPETSDVDEIVEKPPTNLASRTSALYQGRSDIDDDHVHIRPNGAEERIITSENSGASSHVRGSSSEAHESKAREIEKTPYSPLNVASRSSTLYQGGSDIYDSANACPKSTEQIVTDGKSVISSPVRRFSSGTHMSKACEIEKRPYTPPNVAPRNSTLYQGCSDIHDSAHTRPNGAEQEIITSEKSVVYSPVSQFSSEARVSKPRETERISYPPPPNLASRSAGLYQGRSDIRDYSAHARPNGADCVTAVEKPAISSPVRGFISEARVSKASEIESKLYPAPKLASRSAGLYQGSSNINDAKLTRVDHITTAIDKPVVSSPVRGFFGEAQVSKSSEIKEKPYSVDSPMDSVEPTKPKKVTKNPPSNKGKEITTNPPSKKGKEIITENISDVMKNEEDDSIEAMWDAINRGNKKAKKKKLKKSETWEIPKQRRREVQRLDSEEVLPSSPLWKELKKAVTFNDSISAMLRGGLMRRDDSWTRDEFNKRIDGFIKAKKNDMRDEMEESKRRKFLDLFRRG